ncbi:hypothetical protein EV356DRAFT_185282 [Viridothelium virens]|uniref:Uncharacterized protein n=1 Tax=Viridothelium virens TaxID=1048519 RepID=A0A6A6H800_VIRVR|nr:hypothetical protein EV356DRAFT_185282 [Viridothelium virens]
MSLTMRDKTGIRGADIAQSLLKQSTLLCTPCWQQMLDYNDDSPVPPANSLCATCRSVAVTALESMGYRPKAERAVAPEKLAKKTKKTSANVSDGKGSKPELKVPSHTSSLPKTMALEESLSAAEGSRSVDRGKVIPATLSDRHKETSGQKPTVNGPPAPLGSSGDVLVPDGSRHRPYKIFSKGVQSNPSTSLKVAIVYRDLFHAWFLVEFFAFVSDVLELASNLCFH